MPNNVNVKVIKNLLTVFGNFRNLRAKNDKLLNIHKIPNYFQNYTKLTLYFGDWRRIESDCLYLRDKRDFDNLTVLSKISNRNSVNHNLNLADEGLVECSGILENCKFVYFPNHNNVKETESLSLLVPLDIFHSEMYNSTDVNYIKDSKEFVTHLNSLGFNKILLCSGNNNVYNFYHNLLKYYLLCGYLFLKFM
ncbi:hypothetical protein TpMuguga_01g02250 [Theileria parva strain Muguga]|uniref:uncharacterized protein n=1 Tax=Theileria parva strain Muguga TaxID=333668 RepID=UPI001C61FEE0|nr:uncharacterized protein TpMuguga_01g02250 [Theileria parva strain Muguga]KAF5153397.1 hypothetical protein TpMuguga_01g02250 [Theileria parva strain Muguga]